MHEQSYCHKCANKGHSDIAVDEYLSITYQESLWIDPSLTSSRDFLPQHLAPPYPATHATEDIISSTTIHMLLSLFVTSHTFSNYHPLLSIHIMGVISWSRLQNSSMTVRKIPFKYRYMSITSKINLSSLLSPLDSKLELKFHPFWRNSSNRAPCRIMLVRYQYMKATDNKGYGPKWHKL